jgi:hypothetical protein
MSSLPSQMISSTLQSALQQHQAQQARSLADRRRSDTSAAIIQASQRHQDQIDNAGADSEVNPDGSGAGGQGRAFHEEPQPDLPAAVQPPKDGSVATDGDGSVHLDVTA